MSWHFASPSFGLRRKVVFHKKLFCNQADKCCTRKRWAKKHRDVHTEHTHAALLYFASSICVREFQKCIFGVFCFFCLPHFFWPRRKSLYIYFLWKLGSGSTSTKPRIQRSNWGSFLDRFPHGTAELMVCFGQILFVSGRPKGWQWRQQVTIMIAGGKVVKTAYMISKEKESTILVVPVPSHSFNEVISHRTFWTVYFFGAWHQGWAYVQVFKLMALRKHLLAATLSSPRFKLPVLKPNGA